MQKCLVYQVGQWGRHVLASASEQAWSSASEQARAQASMAC